MTPTRVLYIQYTNPAAYPPLEQGATQLADAGCAVLFLGAQTRAVRSLQLPPHPRITCTLFDGDVTGGWRLKWHFLRFTAWSVARALRYRPDWVYVSDIMAAPAGWLLAAVWRMRVIYHEHDRFEPAAASVFMRVCLAARQRVARAAVANVLPSDGRLAQLCTDTGVTPDRCIRVWNCPSVTYGRSKPAPAKPDGLRLLFYGSITPSRVTLSLLQALEKLPGVSLRVIGFETGESIGCVDRLRREAAALGIAARVEFLGPMSHTALFPHADDCDVGLACTPMRSGDANMQSMAGASNKAFEFLARGLPLLVSPLPDWEEIFVAPGYGITCDIESVDSIVAALRWYLDDPARRWSMGERGRQRVLAEWNYERQFAPVRRLVVARSDPSARRSSGELDFA
jgi:glycosyltransferase involved in cell wall biosynthesis